MDNSIIQPTRIYTTPIKVLRAKEAARYCGISNTTFDTWISKARTACIQIAAKQASHKTDKVSPIKFEQAMNDYIQQDEDWTVSF